VLSKIEVTLPMFPKLRMLMLLPMWKKSKTLAFCPSREKLRRLTDEPRCTHRKMLQFVRSILLNPRTDTVLCTRMKERRERVLPKLEKSRKLAVEPHLIIERRLTADPRCEHESTESLSDMRRPLRIDKLEPSSANVRTEMVSPNLP
jgi:hypothetical protein